MERGRLNLPALLENSKKRIMILTTNLNYTFTNLADPIEKSLKLNADNPGFKVEILTMDPESDVATARAVQLGRKIRAYRDELRSSLDGVIKKFEKYPEVEIVTYDYLPTQMTFIIDRTVITAVVSLGQQSREGVHFVLDEQSNATEPFLSHFRVLKTLARASQ